MTRPDEGKIVFKKCIFHCGKEWKKEIEKKREFILKIVLDGLN